MSFDAMSWALKQDDVFGNEKWVLFMMAYRDNHEEPHGCFPSMRRLACDCGIDKMTVCRAIQALVQKGKITEQKRRGKSGAPISSYYYFPQVYALRIHGVRATHTGGVRTTHTEPNNLTGTQRKPRAQSRSARDRIDDEIEKRRRVAAQQKRQYEEEAVRREVKVGSGPR
jgi:hypothetical protein